MRIASHARSFEPGDWVREPAHFQGLYRPETTPATAPTSESQPNPVARPLSAYTAVVEGGRP
jgi:hypothetical protein